MTIRKENILKDYVLLVEGKSDKEFFETLFRNKENELLGDKKIPMFILVPDELNPDSGNNKTNLIKELIVQINSFKDANLKRLGVIVDADFKNINNGGVEKTMKTISDALLKKDYLKIETSINSDSATFKGFVFKNDAGYPDINIWIMPNNKDDGYLEYFIKDNIIENKKDKLQASLFEYAIDCFSKIPDKQVIQHRDIDKSKSEIATWLAFQKKPQYSLAAVVNLIDFTQHTAKNLMDWLKDTFPKTENL
jgi:hypothetical protein